MPFPARLHPRLVSEALGDRDLDAFALELDEPARDDIDATVDYRDVVACVREVSDGTHFQLLESLAAAVADELKRRFPVSSARVRVGKPELELDGGRATVTAER